MSEKISMHNREHNDAMAFAIEALTLAKPKFADFADVVDGPELEVSLTVNGVEVSFVKTVNLFADLSEELLNRKAAELAYGKFRSLIDTLEECREEVRSRIWDTFKVDPEDQ